MIDSYAGPHLTTIRTKLGLSPTALIIPSDVHDHFVDVKILSQDLFVAASGGNILDADHVENFISGLNERKVRHANNYKQQPARVRLL